MLKKLYKYDFRCSARQVLPIFLIYFTVAILFKVMNFLNIDHPIFQGSLAITAGVFVVITFGLVFYGFGTAMVRFKKNLFTDEGYLMNTLPVEPWQHIVSKLLNAFTWGIFCILASIIGFCFMLFGEGLLGELSVFFEEIKNFFEKATAADIINVILIIANVIGFVITISICGFFSTAAESSFPILKKRGFFVVGVIAGIFIFYFGSSIYTLLVDEFIEAVGLTGVNADIFAMSVSIITQIILQVVFFVFTCKFMKNKLNLE